MSLYKKPVWRETRIPCRVIKRLYGSNSDDAGDDIYEALQLVSEYQGQYKYRFDSDTRHPNPWYHTLIFAIEGISDSEYEQFLQKLVAKGLLDAPTAA